MQHLRSRVSRALDARRRRRDERGATAIIMALMLVMLIGVAALGVDIASNVESKQQLRDTMDMAAHAAAFELPGNDAGAVTVAINTAKTADPDASPAGKLFCVVGSTGGTTPRAVWSQVPSTCSPGVAPYNDSAYPYKSTATPNGYTCNQFICAIPCNPATGVCNTIMVWDEKTVDYDFAPAIGYETGSTGQVVATACKGSCGSEIPNPMDIVIMADRTASMAYADRQAMKTAILDSLKTMTPSMHFVAFGTLHKSRITAFTPKASAKGPQTDSSGTYDGHWDGTGDTNGDGRCYTEAYKLPKDSKGNLLPAADYVTEGTWMPVEFQNNYLTTSATPTLNNSSLLVDGISCLPQSKSGEFGTHLAGAMKGAVRYLTGRVPNNLAALNAATPRPGTVRKAIIFETDGMPDEVKNFGDVSLSTGDLGSGTQSSSSSAGENGCTKFKQIATAAKAEGITIITIGFGEAATQRCRKGSSSTSYSRVRDVLAAAASNHPTTNAPSAASDCSVAAQRTAENADGDYFFCAAGGAELGAIFKTALSSLGGGVKLIKVPK